MRNSIFCITLGLLLFSCDQSEIKQKELELREREIALKEKELALQEKDSSNSKTTTADTINKTGSEIKNSSPNEKSMTMIFKEYSEGDLMHLIFRDTESGKEYDFGNDIDDKKFNNIKILLEDNDAAFGFRANPKYLNKEFIVEALYKQVLTSDPITGETVKTKAWVINNLKKIE